MIIIVRLEGKLFYVVSNQEINRTIVAQILHNAHTIAQGGETVWCGIHIYNH